MNSNELEKFIGRDNITVSQSMQKIDASHRGILFLVDTNQRLTYCITDGDIRRFLLTGGRIDEPAINAANNHPKFAYDISEALTLYHKRDRIAIPIVDSEHHITDIYEGDGITKKPHNSLNIPVVINAGGKGTRLEPFTRIFPKPLIPVGDLPIIEHIMREYQSYSCNDFHIILNYKRELVKAYFSPEASRHYSITWYDEHEYLGTGGGLSLLKGRLSSTFFFTNCDNLLTANYERILQFHREHNNMITMICAYKNISIPYGVVDMGINGKIERMREKPLISLLTNTGIYIVEPEVLDDIEPGVSVGFPSIVERERQKGMNVAVFPVGESEWMDMGQLSELEKMRRNLYGDAY